MHLRPGWPDISPPSDRSFALTFEAEERIALERFPHNGAKSRQVRHATGRFVILPWAGRNRSSSTAALTGLRLKAFEVLRDWLDKQGPVPSILDTARLLDLLWRREDYEKTQPPR